jgi:predicted nucleic acid-binding Zn ribbon protein
MADCPNCGTWNPDDKVVCWRCQAELPKPVVKKKRRPTIVLGLPVWAWIVLVVLLVAWIATQCYVGSPTGIGG